MDYKASGVDITEEQNSIRSLIKNLTYRRTDMPGSLVSPDGHFSSLIDMGEYYLSMCTDGVGTKLLLAEEMKKYDTVGIDCMAMNVNDLICVGAEPVAFVDYIASDKIEADTMSQVSIGLNEGAKQANVNIVGGETATMKGMVNGLDLSGTALGYVKKGCEITGKDITEGDVLIGLASSGFHSNGYTLIRNVLAANEISLESNFDSSDKSVGEALIEPTQIYVRGIIDVINKFPGSIHGIAHITGGGITNIIRLVNWRKEKQPGFSIHSWPKIPPIMTFIQKMGEISIEEMFKTFNMGIGIILVTDASRAHEILQHMNRHYQAFIIGNVVSRPGVNLHEFNIKFDKY